jgi:hypothetical protein
MFNNMQKSKLENMYIAEKKYNMHKSGLSFKQIRNSLDTSYGGFDTDGIYFNNKNVYRSIDCNPASPVKFSISPIKHSPNRSTLSSIKNLKKLNPNYFSKKRGRKNLL